MSELRAVTISEDFEYDPDARRYRDSESGKFVSEKTVQRARERLINMSHSRIDDLADQLTGGTISLDDFERLLRKEIKQLWIDQYVLGRGGIEPMTFSDWGRLGQQIRVQYDYLRNFVAEINAGTLSDAKIKARAKLYASSSAQGYGQATAVAWDIDFPAIPGDGSTECRQFCRCRWSVVEREDWIEATWTLGTAEHCEDCIRRSREWAPLRYDKVTGFPLVEDVM